MTQELKPIPEDVFVFDAQCHAINFAPANWKLPDAKALVDMAFAMTNGGTGLLSEYAITYETFARDWTAEDCANVLFLESESHIALFVPLAIYSFHDGMCASAKAAEVKKRWPDRFLVSCTVDPLAANRIEEFERQVELLDPVALKLYPSSYAHAVHEGWRMDDPEIAFPLFEKAQQLGVRIISIHKALPTGRVPMESYKVADVEDAARCFPDLTFEIIHGGFAFSEELAWQVARYPNIRVNLDTTSVLCWLNPRRFSQILVDLLSVGGHDIIDRLHWSTGGGSPGYPPQPTLEAFWNLEMPEDLFLQGAFESEPYQLTEEDKRKILGLNAAELMGIDIEETRARIADDEFSKRRAENGGRFEPWSTVPVEPVKKAVAA